jgi:hypothetical protein
MTLLPRMVKSIALKDFERASKKVRKAVRLQNVFLAPVRFDSPISEQNHPFDLRNNVVQMMCHKQEPDPARSKSPQMVSHLMERRQVKACRWLIEEQSRWVVNQSPGNQKPARFTGRELIEPSIGKTPNLQPLHCSK